MIAPVAAKKSRRRLSEPEIQDMHAEMIKLGQAILAGKAAEPKPHDRITWGFQLVIGFDRLKYGLHVEWKDSELLDILTDFKNLAHEQHQPVSCTVPGLAFESVVMGTSGRQGGYAFHLSSGDVHLYFSTRKNFMETPNIWVDIGSSSCWVPGYQYIIDMLEEFIAHHGGKIHKTGISEVHLCADCVGMDISQLEGAMHSYGNWITRSNKFHPFYERELFTGIETKQTQGRLGLSDDRCDYFGEKVESGLQLAKGDIMLRVYDKVLEINRDGAKQSLFASVWGKEEYNDQPVTRVEFQLRRPVLRQLGVDTYTDLLEKVSGLWEYCTCNWAVLCAERPDKQNRNQSRAVRHEFWLAIQKADWGSYQPVVRKKIRALKDRHQSVDQFIGIGLNIATIDRACDDVEDVISSLQQVVESACRAKYEEIGKSGFPVLLEKLKRKKSEIWPYGMNAEVHGA
ncbi:hypothetical protein [Candidatus Electronema sp. JM]|uniref:hypothetical protein n=1 Tax=Candidatus Electronema sp. JM TaxID=3401571 RepID=UPI003AA8613A